MLRSISRAAARPGFTGIQSRLLSSRVKILNAEEEFATTVASPNLSVVYFTASWCGPCKMISPVFEAVAEEHTSAAFLKVDVDDQPDVAAAAQVTAMPTFQFFKSGKLLDKIVGADIEKLQEYTKAHS